MNLQYSPIDWPAELPFLQELYISTRWEEVAVLIDWTATQKLSFLSEQFSFQHAYYMEQYPAAKFLLLKKGQQKIGRLYLEHRENEIRIIDIALLPAYRRQGIGSSVLKGVLAEAEEKEMLVRIHVERNNPALNLYDQLGFRKIGDTGVYYLMEWSAAV